MPGRPATGAPVVTELERAVEQSRYTVAMLSPLLHQRLPEFENVLADHAGPT